MVEGLLRRVDDVDRAGAVLAIRLAAKSSPWQQGREQTPAELPLEFGWQRSPARSRRCRCTARRRRSGRASAPQTHSFAVDVYTHVWLVGQSLTAMLHLSPVCWSHLVPVSGPTLVSATAVSATAVSATLVSPTLVSPVPVSAFPVSVFPVSVFPVSATTMGFGSDKDADTGHGEGQILAENDARTGRHGLQRRRKASGASRAAPFLRSVGARRRGGPTTQSRRRNTRLGRSGNRGEFGSRVRRPGSKQRDSGAWTAR